ncbi:uncharacterized protein [Diadema setosum]|uniref:uncharacterized protein n=1 Tax=Diadema setosum TaxID=31175 RepID=UPI003B3AF150
MTPQVLATSQELMDHVVLSDDESFTISSEDIEKAVETHYRHPTWTFYAPGEQQRIVFAFQVLSFDEGRDFLKIGDGLISGSSSQLVSFSGHTLPSEVVSVGNLAWLRLKLRTSYQGRAMPQLNVTVSVIDHFDSMAPEGGWEDGSMITLESPNHPDNYPNNYYRIWDIVLPYSFLAEVSFMHLNTEDGADVLWAGEGVHAFNANDPAWQNWTGERTGEILRRQAFNSTSSTLTVVFASDHSISKPGFQMTIRAIRALSTSPQEEYVYQATPLGFDSGLATGEHTPKQTEPATSSEPTSSPNATQEPTAGTVAYSDSADESKVLDINGMITIEVKTLALIVVSSVLGLVLLVAIPSCLTRHCRCRAPSKDRHHRRTSRALPSPPRQLSYRVSEDAFAAKLGKPDPCIGSEWGAPREESSYASMTSILEKLSQRGSREVAFHPSNGSDRPLTGGLAAEAGSKKGQVVDVNDHGYMVMYPGIGGTPPSKPTLPDENVTALAEPNKSQLRASTLVPRLPGNEEAASDGHNYSNIPAVKSVQGESTGVAPSSTEHRMSTSDRMAHIADGSSITEVQHTYCAHIISDY